MFINIFLFPLTKKSLAKPEFYNCHVLPRLHYGIMKITFGAKMVQAKTKKKQNSPKLKHREVVTIC